MFDSENGDFDIQKSHINDSGEYVVTAGLGNNGILGKTNINAKIIDSNTITVDMFGNSFYRKFKYKMVTHARVFSLIPKFNMSEKQGLYIVNSFKYLMFGFGYENMCSWAKIQNNKIQLPTKDGKIDFEFMDACIRELEEERIRELSAYLTVSGLDNYKLSSEEKEALDAYGSIMFGECKFKDIFNKIRIGDLFEIKPTKTYKLTNEDLFEKNGLYPVVTNSSVNNGITGYTNLSPTEKGNMITYSDTTTSDGIFYQPTDYIGYSHIQGLYPLVHKEKWEHKSLMYIVTCFRKSASGRFDYGNKFNRNIAKEMSIQLPTKDGKIDFEFMELLISAVQKLVIKDVVLYADEKIQSTKKIVKES